MSITYLSGQLGLAQLGLAQLGQFEKLGTATSSGALLLLDWSGGFITGDMLGGFNG
jgi:hypothetical protein